jgi:transcriptional regulator with XRE-family HTH domain
MGREPKSEIGKFLRLRREHLIPEDVGLPPSARRRTAGLRREEVAILAGVSVTWYTYLEQGRGRDVSPAVIDGVARALQLSEDERRYMHYLVYGRVINPRPLDEAISISPLLAEITSQWNTNPYPAYLLNGDFDILAWNDAAVEWYADWNALPKVERNLLVWMLTSKEAKRRIADWEAAARDVVMQWRARITRQPIGKYAEQISHLKNRSPEFRKWWDSHLVLEHRVRTWIFNHPKIGTQELQLVPMTSFYEDEPLIIFHIPKSMIQS